MVKTPIKFNEKVEVLSENYTITESDKGVIIEGLAITFEKPTRNRVSYTYESGSRTHKTLVGKPFLDSHIDKTIHNNPPFGHVIETWLGKNPKNNLPALFYKVDVDPMEETFIRKLKRGDIGGVSVQVLVDSVTEKMDSLGEYMQANIREFLELSAVLIPGDGDTTMKFIESYNSYKEDLDTSNGNAVFDSGGVLPKRKVIRKDPETNEQSEGCGNSKSKIFEPNPIVDDTDGCSKNHNRRLKGKKMDNKKDKTPEEDSYEERFNSIESKIEKLLEGLEKGQPENDKKGKLKGKEEDPENYFSKNMEKIGDMIKEAVKESLTGSVEREDGYEKKSIGPKGTNNITATQQPANGKAPSGGKLLTDDKMGEDEANDAIKKAKTPKDSGKIQIQKNSLENAKSLIEQAKIIMKEFRQDPLEGESADEAPKNPRKMDKSEEPKNSDSGFKEKSKDDNEDDADVMDKMYESLKAEIKQEKSNRKTMMDIPIKIEESLNKINKDSIGEYLKKSKYM